MYACLQVDYLHILTYVPMYTYVCIYVYVCISAHSGSAHLGVAYYQAAQLS